MVLLILDLLKMSINLACESRFFCSSSAAIIAAISASTRSSLPAFRIRRCTLVASATLPFLSKYPVDSCRKKLAMARVAGRAIWISSGICHCLSLLMEEQKNMMTVDEFFGCRISLWRWEHRILHYTFSPTSANDSHDTIKGITKSNSRSSVFTWDHLDDVKESHLLGQSNAHDCGYKG